MDNRPIYRNPKTVAFVLIVLVAFWPIALALPHEYALTISSSLALAVAIGIVARWWEGGVEAATTPRSMFHGGHQLVFGILAVWALYTTLTVWIWSLRHLGSPEWMPTRLIGAYFVYLFFACGLIFLGAQDYGQPTKGRRRLGIVVAAAAAVAALVIFVTIREDAKVGREVIDVLRDIHPMGRR